MFPSGLGDGKDQRKLEAITCMSILHDVMYSYNGIPLRRIRKL